MSESEHHANLQTYPKSQNSRMLEQGGRTMVSKLVYWRKMQKYLENFTKVGIYKKNLLHPNPILTHLTSPADGIRQQRLPLPSRTELRWRSVPHDLLREPSQCHRVAEKTCVVCNVNVHVQTI